MVVPALTMGVLAATLGWVVTDLSCRSSSPIEAGCPGWGAMVGGLSFLAVGFGVGLVLVLVYRSLGEWRGRK